MRPWVLAAAAALALACGDGSDGGPEDPGGQQPSCVPSTCETLGATCGAIADGCGGALECGECGAGQSCGAGGRPNVCAPVSFCQPATCDGLGKDCGPVPDGCGGVLDCGACTGGEQCGAGGEANVCAPPAQSCAPATCASLGKDCGSVPDGCGGTLACGTCGDGEACGAAGVPNVCAAPPPEPEVRWFDQLDGPADELVLGVAADDAGRRYALSALYDWAPARFEVALRWWEADGSAAGEKRWGSQQEFGFQLAGGFGGALAVLASGWCSDCARAPDFGGGRLEAGATLVVLGPEGAFRWQARLDGGATSVTPTADGGAVVGGWSAIRRFGAGGEERWSAPVSGWASCTADRDGNVICAEVVGNDPTVARIRKRAAQDGRVLWVRDVTGLGQAMALATSDQGTVALLAWRTGDVEAGPDVVREGPMALVVLEHDGRFRWAKGMEVLAGLAVDPTGRVAVFGPQPGCGAVAAHAFMLGGAPLWSRTIPSDGACWAGVAVSSGAYGRDHALTLGGWLWGTLTLGGTRLQPRGQDGLVVTLSP